MGFAIFRLCPPTTRQAGGIALKRILHDKKIGFFKFSAQNVLCAENLIIFAANFQ
jgi:hypothetical protein